METSVRVHLAPVRRSKINNKWYASKRKYSYIIGGTIN